MEPSPPPCTGKPEDDGCACSSTAVVVAAPTAGAAKKKRRRRAPKRRVASQVPAELLSDPLLAEAMRALPDNYNFEVHKTVWRIRRAAATRVALQFPEGLLMYSCVLADIIERFTGASAIIMGDVTYGACCVDDFTALALGADFLVHYGHSCLVPIDVTTLPTMYVFVEIGVDAEHLVATIRANFEPTQKLALLGTVQFAAAIHAAKAALADTFTDVIVPQAKPLSPGEVLGCTSPTFTDRDAFIFVADGRFHLESAMMGNPDVPAYQYDPFSKALSREHYDHKAMRTERSAAIGRAAAARSFGVVLGTLGRQGSTAVLNRVEQLLREAGKPYFVLLLSEIFPDKLAKFKHVDAWVQIACPRLSIDWGAAMKRPLLTPFELEVVMGQVKPVEDGAHPMDYYSHEAGPHGNYFERRKKEEARKAERAARRAEKAARKASRAARAAAAREESSV